MSVEQACASHFDKTDRDTSGNETGKPMRYNAHSYLYPHRESGGNVAWSCFPLCSVQRSRDWVRVRVCM